MSLNSSLLTKFLELRFVQSVWVHVAIGLRHYVLVRSFYRVKCNEVRVESYAAQ